MHLITASKNVKQKVIEIKGEIKSAIILGDFSTLLCIIDRTNGQKTARI